MTSSLYALLSVVLIGQALTSTSAQTPPTKSDERILDVFPTGQGDFQVITQVSKGNTAKLQAVSSETNSRRVLMEYDRNSISACKVYKIRGQVSIGWIEGNSLWLLNTSNNAKKKLLVAGRDNAFVNWWLFETGKTTILIVDKYTREAVDGREPPFEKEFRLLVRYALYEDGPKPVSHVLIDGLQVQCSTLQENVVIWQTRIYRPEPPFKVPNCPIPNSELEILSFFKWNEPVRGEWHDVYMGNESVGLVLDSYDARKVLVWEWKSPQNASGVYSLISMEDEVIPIGGYKNKHSRSGFKLLSLPEKGCWIVGYQTRDHIVLKTYDEKSHDIVSKQLEGKDAQDFYLLRYRGTACLIVLKKNGVSIRDIP